MGRKFPQENSSLNRFLGNGDHVFSKTFNNLDQRKQNRIFLVAVTEFSRYGFAKASINRLVEDLGIAKGSVFQYFGDKEGLFTFVFSRAVTMVKDFLKRARDESKGQDFFARLESILVSGVDFIRKHPRIYALYTKIQFEGNLSFCSRLLASLRGESYGFIAGLIETGIERGELRPDLDVRKTAFLLDAVLDRFLQACVVEHLDAGQGLFHAEEEALHQWARAVVDLVRTGVAKKGA
jgi:TetR/AcrR family transcriptional regulator